MPDQFPKLLPRLREALKEDGAFNDVTTRQIPQYCKKITKARLVAKAPGLFCGEFVIKPTLAILDPRRAKVRFNIHDGANVKPGQTVAVLHGSTRAILGAERVVLNLVCHLSGIATLTSKFVEAVRGTGASILETRKTIPLWRDLEKYAVLCGGGQNHRMSLSDAILVKDNHLSYLRRQKLIPSVIYGADSLRRKRAGLKFVEMEAANYADVWEAIKAQADIILLDNMPLNQIKGSIVFIQEARKALNSQRPLIEVSGGITLEKARVLAACGVDRLSVGALTHSAPALDFSLEVD